MTSSLEDLAYQNGLVSAHPEAWQLLRSVKAPTFLMPSGYPYLGESAFIRFIRTVPHLFENGARTLEWLSKLRATLENWEDPERPSCLRAIKVLKTIVRTASITAPPDLWLMRYVLAAHHSLGITRDLIREEVIEPEEYAKRRGLNARQLKIDLHFLHCRGYLDYEAPCFSPPRSPLALKALTRDWSYASEWARDWTQVWVDWFSGDSEVRSEWLEFQAPNRPGRPAWVPTPYEVELGHRLLPVVLAMRSLELTTKLQKGACLEEHLTRTSPALSQLFERAALTSSGLVTELGQRVFARGPGPFGIIGTYYPYVSRLEEILSSVEQNVWVRRGKNVVASQLANRKTFQLANQLLDRFSDQTGFQYSVFIEHAVGRGEAVRQRFEASGDNEIRYFGADLEDDAIEEAVEQQKLGVLPDNMKFVRQADIGSPEKVIEFIRAEGLKTEGAVMMVGNGFHEIRNQTNEKMLEVFGIYQKAGILIIFTEETGLTDTDLLATAWNTYHAGFRFVHEMSGQGLRPSWNRRYLQKVWSWRRCAQKAGYYLHEDFTLGTRPIYPIPKKGRENPSISVTYFCIPEMLSKTLGFKSVEQLGEPGYSATE
jgi:hypothetical protein